MCTSLSSVLFASSLSLKTKERHSMTQLDYSNEPKRNNNQLIVRKDKPFNAEPQLSDLIKRYITPEPHFFIRSHGPVPMDLETETHSVTVTTLDGTQYHIPVLDLMSKFEKVDVVMAMQCAGNRRDGLHRVKHTKGVIWGAAAIGNGLYSGCRLRDVLHFVGINTHIKNIQRLHVAFESVEQCEEDVCYGTSIPLSKALDEFGDVLLAYEMNHAPLTRDHGYPIRVVVPGYIGARSVKYLKSITVQDHESTAFFQQRDYKLLPGMVSTESDANAYWCKVPSINEYNVQSYVCSPPNGEVSEAKMWPAQGYALSGGGRSIQRVGMYITQLRRG
ncbi:Oxidoreductase, molybdopterin-binding domain-containing protein [Dichotomocladium elegans]|nr:Oxidoreductase, molybdopterin-binding domain-containing protein [Dichotomocladium elegans]